MKMDLDTEIAKITEAYCLQQQLPIRRRFTDAELERTFELLDDSAALAHFIEEQARAEGGL
jgi:hypothetical protein